MTMPKKGTRTLTIGGKTYNYTVKPVSGNATAPFKAEKRLVIEARKGVFITKDFTGSMTPGLVKAALEQHGFGLEAPK